jgi:hypothetical protein
MLLALAVGACVLPAGAGDNLLGNPGFEQQAGDLPLKWDAYVGTADPDGGGGGAVAALDHRAYSGEACVRLHTPIPYGRDPLNNWSQNLIKDLGGKAVRLSAQVRTEAASEAGLILQCWRKQPWGVMHVARTSDENPIHGTQDWTECGMRVDVPKGTDFVTVRLVLTGAGTAWFDDVSLTLADAPEKPAPAAKKPAPAEEPAIEPEEKMPTPQPAEAHDTMEPETPLVEDTVAPEGEGETDYEADREAAATAAAELERLRLELQQMHNLNLMLEEALSGTEEENDLLLQDMLMLQESLEELEDRQRALMQPFIGDGEFAPPLVPRGEDWRHLR